MWTLSVLDYYRDLAEQLAAMPGGHASLRQDYFAGVTLAEPVASVVPAMGELLESWALVNGGALALSAVPGGDLQLAWLKADSAETLLSYPAALLQAAREFSITPLGLGLLALAMGGADDKGRLKQLLPDVHKASKGLLLIAVCRLCG